MATRLAEAAPIVVGLKTIVNMQMELAGRDVEQVFDSSENSLALVPENKRLLLFQGREVSRAPVSSLNSLSMYPTTLWPSEPQFPKCAVAQMWSISTPLLTIVLVLLSMDRK